MPLDAGQQAQVGVILDRTKTALGRQYDLDEESAALLLGDVLAALEAIQAPAVTNRLWLTASEPSSRFYDAPDYPVINIDELQTDPAPVVTAYGVELVAGTDYNLIYNDYGTLYVQVERTAYNYPAWWTSYPTPYYAGPRRQIEIEGVWGVTQIPDQVLRVWEALAVRYFRRRTHGQSEQGGSDDQGVSTVPRGDKDLYDALLPFKRVGPLEIGVYEVR